MSRPSLRRALQRHGLTRTPAPPRPPGPRNLGVVPPPRIYLPGEPEDAGPVDLAALFGRSAPTELEIGLGKGRFLLGEAAVHPERCYLGLELQLEYARIARARAERLGLANVRVECVDGKAFVIRRLPEACLAAMHLYFPDPWPKKRHHKRRLVDGAFAAAAARALEPGAPLRVASDHEEYFRAIAAALDAEPLLRRVPDADAGDWSSGTNYELKFQASGKRIGRAIWRRKG